MDKNYQEQAYKGYGLLLAQEIEQSYLTLKSCEQSDTNKQILLDELIKKYLSKIKVLVKVTNDDQLKELFERFPGFHEFIRVLERL